MPIYVYPILAAVCFLILWFAFWIAAWETWDDYRRLERRAHLNLKRQSGEWTL